MKKILFASAMALVLSASASAKTADELRVYINPGHGSWYSNDRPMNIIRLEDGEIKVINPNTKSGTAEDSEGWTPDTTAFYESNTNLRKGFGVLNQLVAMGLKYDATLNQENETPSRVGAALDMSNNIVMSHVKVGPYPNAIAEVEFYNRSLSEIAKEVETNNFDMFISIHSNAATEGTNTNYPLFLYRGHDTPAEEEGCTLEHQQISRAMSAAAWPHVIANKFGMWTAYTSSTNLRGDINFYGSSSTNAMGYKGYLGAIKHGVPGYLAEGYFHTYQPARHRAMNWDVDLIEGYAYAMGVADYWNLKKPSTGNLYGIVRDQHEKFSHEYYKPNVTTDDAYLSLNGASVKLYKGDELVGEYTTDNHFNGAYVFHNLTPGTYKVVATHPDYKEMEGAMEVEVKAAETTYAPSLMLENVAYEPPTEVFENYPNVYDAKEIIAEEYVFSKEYVDQEIPELEGKTIRRAILHKDKIYVLALDAENAPTLLVYDPVAKEVVANVSTEGMEGTHLACSDIQVTSDHVLLACNKEKNQYSAAYIDPEDNGHRGTFYIYKWANDENGLPTGDPQKWLSSQATGNWYRSYSGDTFAYSGTSDEGKAIFSCETTGSSRNLRTQLISVVSGVGAGESFHQPWYNGSSDGFTVKVLGDDYRFTTSPADDSQYIITGSGEAPAMLCNYAHTNKAEVLALNNEAFSNTTNGVQFFKYAGADFMVAPEVAGANVGGVALTNIAAGIDGAKTVAATNGDVESAEAASQHAMGTAVAVLNNDYEVVGGYMDLYLLRDNKLSYFTSNVPQPVNEAAYAYAISSTEKADNLYDVTFKVTAPATKAALVLHNTTADAEDEIIELGAVEKGENTFPVDLTDLESGTYTWKVEITGKTNPKGGKVYDDPNGLTVRGGMVVITDPEQDSFGYAITSNGNNNGIDLYAPDHNKVGNFYKGDSRFNDTNQSSLFRGDQLEGKAVFCDWSDKGSGYWVFDPMSPETNLYDMLLGENNGTGAHIYNGTNIGGGSSCVAFQNIDGNLRMYTFIEDWPTGNKNNQIVCYNLGDKRMIDVAPDETYDYTKSRYFANTNVDIVPCGNGFFASQCRSQGNDAAGTPCFIYSAIGSDTPLYNSGNDLKLADGCTSGIAVSPDGKYFAVHSYSGTIHVYDLAWAENGAPVLTLNHDIKTKGSVTWSQIKFDYANNIHVFDRENKGYAVYAPAAEAPVVSTPAKAEYAFVSKASGVEDITADEAAAPEAAAVYYDLRGIRVDADNLTPGVYVKVAGNKASKVVVR